MAQGWPGVLGFAILLALPPAAYGQEIWRHDDGQGRVRYADRPFPGAVRIDPPGAASWLARAGPASESPPGQNESQVATPVSAPRLEISSPAADETVWGGGGQLEVRLAIDGDMEDGARISIRLDGAEVSWRGEPPVLRLKEVWRGEHRLRARLLDAEGRQLAASEEVRFFKREPAISRTQAR